MSKLRGPNGCPWDKEQDHQSLLRYLKEESQEFITAVKNKDMKNMEEELGDILLQILFHAQIARENKKFDINDVLHTLKTKLVRRHPHVFKKGKKETLSSEEVKKRWKIIKSNEKKIK